MNKHEEDIELKDLMNFLIKSAKNKGYTKDITLRIMIGIELETGELEDYQKELIEMFEELW